MSNPKSRERVIIQEIVGLDVSKETLKDWPSGSALLQAMLPTFANLLPSTDAEYWQMAARRALLVECGFLPKDMKDSNGETLKVTDTWNKLLEDEALSNEDNKSVNDLLEFFGAGGKSNRRQLQWALMDCAPGCQFNLHAHPNLELVYCIKGELHEIRLDDDDHVITKDFATWEQSPNDNDDNTKKNPKVIGPSLMGCQRPWHFKTLSQGNWLVNRVGTIHKSFTATNGEGCVLLTLWGGSHANIPEELSVVTKAVQLVDEKLTTRCAACPSTGGDMIHETFLPDSERRHPQQPLS